MNPLIIFTAAAILPIGGGAIVWRCPVFCAVRILGGLTMLHDTRIQFRINQTLANAAAVKARREKMSVPEYLRHLVRNDTRAA